MQNDIQNLSGIIAPLLSSISSVNPDDIMILSEPIAYLGNKPSQYVSKSIMLSSLSASIIDDMIRLHVFGTMAWKMSSDYSLAGHNHDYYNKIKIQQRYFKDDSIKIATTYVNNEVVNIYAPKQVKDRPPLIGQLKFVYQNKIKDIDVHANDFDGWVYADGNRYFANEFSVKVKEAFDIDKDGMFQVPRLNNFIEMNPFPYISNDMSEEYWHVDPLHSHEANVQLSGNFGGKMLYVCSNSGSGSNSCGANNKDDVWPYTIALDCSNLQIRNQSYIKECQSIGSETHPSYVQIPVMVYIGKIDNLSNRGD